jgi:hypothetical protein
MQRWVVGCVVIAITLFAAARGFTGTDTYSYHMMFSENISIPLMELVKSVEPLFAFLLKAISMVTDNSFVFIAFVSIVQGLILAKLVLTSKKPVIFLLMYVAVFYFEFEFNTLRAGTAILLLVLATRYIDCAQSRAFYLYGAAAVLMHYSTLFALLPLVCVKDDGLRVKIFVITSILLVALIVFTYLLDQSRLGIFSAYFDTVEKDQSSQFGFGFYVIQLLYLIFYSSIVKAEKFVIQTFFLVVWLTLMWLSLSFAYVDRISIILSALFLFLGIEVEVTARKNQVRIIALAGIFIVSLLGNLSTMEGVSTSTELESNYAASPYIPYKFFWEE